MLTEHSDQELVVMLKQGSKAAFEEIFERYSEKAYNLALRISRKEEDAEEILQDTFLNVYSKIESFKGRSAFSSWLYRITFNTALMKLRKRKKHDCLTLEENWLKMDNGYLSIAPVDGFNAGDKDSLRHELRSFLQKAINQLPDEYRTIFILRDIDGHSNQHVAEMVNASVPAVKSRLHRARVMLKKTLKKYYQDYRSETVIWEGEDFAA